MSRRKQAPPKPISPSQSDRQLHNELEHYTCTIDKELSEQTRLLGLEHKKSVCSVVNEALRDHLRKHGRLPER